MKPANFERRVFRDLVDSDLGSELKDATLVSCVFERSNYGETTRTPAERRSIRNVTIRDCRARGSCSIGPVILDEVDVENFKSDGVFIATAAVYRHVRLHGRFGRMLLNFFPSLIHSESKIEAFQRADRAFYKAVDWALDISDIVCAELDIRNVPARLIRRDPQSQVVVRYEKVAALRSVWERLELSGTPWQTALHNVLQFKLEDKVLVAPKALANFERLVEGLRLLQTTGIAEPD